MALTSYLDQLVGGRDLSMDGAYGLMEALAGGGQSPEQVAGVLVAMQTKGVCAQELAGMALYLRRTAVPLSHSFPDLVDTCGTGGGPPTFNLSTGAAIVAASAGARVAKHGNRSVTSKCGSADVLEELGVSLHTEPERLERLLGLLGIVFLFAPHHHGALKSVGPVRRALGVRTVFNLLGPLANPAGAQLQVIGVYEARYVPVVAEALTLLSCKRGFVVHSFGGLDEVSPLGVTHYAEIVNGNLSEGEWHPADFGLSDSDHVSMDPGDSISTSADILRSAIDGSDPSRSLALVPNSAVAILLSGLAETVGEGAALAKSAIETGLAEKKLNQMIEASG
ncbi:MAG: anthranilate phosphoribosyltransferase [Chthonomonadaceae bacterium]|nr:anthranilate phosphoribosyltransferase [Chthonomonadaceae bacterium]